MNETVTIAIIPLDIVQADKDSNLRNVASIMQSIDPATDVVVLPELFSTGFISDNNLMHTLSESNNGSTMDQTRNMARRHNMAICGTFLARTGDTYYNRAFFVEPSGEETFFDKRHLFALSRESTMLSPGRTSSPLIRFRGWTFSMIVCYDIRFPVWCRNTDMAYDIMLVPANWPQSRRYAWEHLIIGRAIENQAYYIGADRSGNDDYGCYDDMTVAVDFYGRHIGERDASSGIVYARTDRQAMTKARKSMPTIQDADIFTIDLLPRRESTQNDN